MTERKIQMPFRLLMLSKTGIGSKIYFFNPVGSTNEVAFEFAQNGEPEGTVVIAKTQTAGHGRSGKSWHSPAGGIYLSVILRPQLKIEELLPLGLVATLALGRSVEKISKIKTLLRWPNDLIINNKKAAGVLVEARSAAEKPEFVILGIGLNVNQTVFPGELKDKATSLSSETEAKTSRAAILFALSAEFDTLYPSFLKSGLSPFIEELNSRFDILGKRVTLDCPGETVYGTALKIGLDGSLVIKKDDGATLSVISGSIVNNF
jgi:BirA family biotin operon repressor/biotin-[acetyl-CoA-carboxylase] ligase